MLKLHYVQNIVVVMLTVGLFLAGSVPVLLPNGPFNLFFHKFLFYINSQQTQWTITCFVCFYLALFILLQHRQSTCRPRGLENPILWQTGVVFIAAMLYCISYPTASLSTDTLTFLTGATLGNGISVLLARQQNIGVVKALIINTLITCFISSSFWHSGTISSNEYHGRIRWTGMTDNPNIFGMIMGVGIVLAIGRIVHCVMLMHEDEQPESARKQKVTSKRQLCLIAAIYIIAAILAGRALLYSYSRGAWIATVLGLGYLLVMTVGIVRRIRVENIKTDFLFGSFMLRLFNLMRRNIVVIFIIALSIGALAFWQFKHSKNQIVADRAFSVINVNDFSWRNRIAAWKGALQIMAEDPWSGAGWNQPEDLYRHYYLSPKLEGGAAFWMNDYLRLGATLGIPALFCFGMYFGLSLFRNSTFGLQPLELLPATCRAGAIVLLVGFWFDGGLFDLSSATVFWILMQLGRQNLQPAAS